MNRGLSVLVAGIYATLALRYGTPIDAARIAAATLFPLMCIWFPEAMGQYSGLIRFQPITSTTPAVLVFIGGWFLLVGVPIILLSLVGASEQT